MTSQQVNWPYVINLGNSIIGVSVLAMPFCFKECGVVLGMLLLFVSAALTHASCNLLMKSATTARRRTYEFLALHTFGPAGKLAVEVSIIGLLIGTCIAFHVIIGDLGPAIVSRFMGVENTNQLRTSLMIIMATFFALPLGLMRSLDSISNISAITIGFYSVFIAEVITLAFPNLWSGVWVAKVVYWNPDGVFKCLPIFSLAFACQTQLFVMYDALPEPSLKRMNTIAKSAIGLCMSAYLCVGYFGYVAFCDEEISGDILLNFRPTIFSEAVKFGFVLSVAVSFPLVIFPCRAAIYMLMFAKKRQAEGASIGVIQEQGVHDNLGGGTYIPPLHFKLITAFIVLLTLIIGICVPNVEFILAMTGATMGSMISYIFPAVMFISIMSMSKTSSKSTAQVVLFLGVTILLASTYVTLNAQDKAVAQLDSVVKIAPDDLPVDEKVKELPAVTPTPAPAIKEPEKLDGDGGGVVDKDNPLDKPLDKQLPPADKETDVKDGDKLESDTGERDDDKRQEPPIPHAPDEDQEKPVEKEEEANKEGNAQEPGDEKKDEGKEDAVGDVKEKSNGDVKEIPDASETKKSKEAKEVKEVKDDANDLVKEKSDIEKRDIDKEDVHEGNVDEKVPDKDVDDKKDVNENVNGDEKPKKKKSKNDKEAESDREVKMLINELEEQRKENKEILQQQKELLEEMKVHQKESHHKETDKPLAAEQAGSQQVHQDQQQQQVPVQPQQAQVPQQQVPIKQQNPQQQQIPQQQQQVPQQQQNPQLQQQVPQQQPVPQQQQQVPQQQQIIQQQQLPLQQQVPQQPIQQGVVIQGQQPQLIQGQIQQNINQQQQLNVQQQNLAQQPQQQQIVGEGNQAAQQQFVQGNAQQQQQQQQQQVPQQQNVAGGNIPVQNQNMQLNNVNQGIVNQNVNQGIVGQGNVNQNVNQGIVGQGQNVNPNLQGRAQNVPLQNQAAQNIAQGGQPQYLQAIDNVLNGIPDSANNGGGINNQGQVAANNVNTNNNVRLAQNAPAQPVIAKQPNAQVVNNLQNNGNVPAGG